MIKVLIITHAFAPHQVIGAIRLTKIAKYLAKYTDVTVLTTERTIATDAFLCRDIDNISIFRFKPKSLREGMPKIEGNPKSKKDSFLKILKNFLISLNLLTSVHYCVHRVAPERKNYYSSRRLLSQLPNKNFDIILSTYSPKWTHRLARYYCKLYPKAFWVADFRDPVYRRFDTPLFAKRAAKTFSGKICKNADVITAVSQGCLDNLFFDSHPNKIVLPNGFDRDDLMGIECSPNTDKFTFSYIGSIYPLRQDLSVLFGVLSQLFTSSLMDRTHVRIEYAGPSKQDFLNQALPFDLLDIIEVSDVIPRTESLRKQQESHLLILATWNNIGEEGVVTGKFYEYMMMGRPIVALVAGNLANSEVSTMVNQGNLGVCYEEACKEEDEKQLKSYILSQYQLFKEGKPLEFSPNGDYINQFDYNNITRQLISLFPHKLNKVPLH